MRKTTFALGIIAAIPLGLILSAPVMWRDATAQTALADTTQSAPGYRMPPTPGAFWIWPTLAEAEQWTVEHPDRPGFQLCIVRVPDGWATEGC